MARESTISCGCVMCLSAMVRESAFCVVVRCPLKALKIFQRWDSGVKRLKVLVNSAQDSRFAFLMTFRHSAFAFLYSRRLSCDLFVKSIFQSVSIFNYVSTFVGPPWCCSRFVVECACLWDVLCCGVKHDLCELIDGDIWVHACFYV